MLPGSFLRARAIGLMPMIDQVKGLSFTAYYCGSDFYYLFEEI